MFAFLSNRATLRRAHAVTLSLALGSAAHAGIVFVDLGDMPLEDDLRLTNGPFLAEFSLHIPCDELPPGIVGPPCITAACGLFADDGDGSAARLSPGEPIGTHLLYVDVLVLAGFELVNPGCTGTTCVFRPIANEWLDRTGAPVRGYIAWGGGGGAAGSRYGWIELTVDYDPAAEAFDVFLHGYAYETQPGVPVTAGQMPCPGDLNGDDAVTLEDLAQMLAAYGSCSGDSQYNGAADLDGDGCIGLGDLSIQIANFGSSCG